MIEKLDPQGFVDYLKKYGNTICGRHPIGVFLNVSRHVTSSMARISLRWCITLVYNFKTSEIPRAGFIKCSGLPKSSCSGQKYTLWPTNTCRLWVGQLLANQRPTLHQHFAVSWLIVSRHVSERSKSTLLPLQCGQEGNNATMPVHVFLEGKHLQPGANPMFVQNLFHTSLHSLETKLQFVTVLYLFQLCTEFSVDFLTPGCPGITRDEWYYTELVVQISPLCAVKLL